MDADHPIPRPTCKLCHVPLAATGCTHVWERDDDVVMSMSSWHRLTDELGRLRNKVGEDA